VSDVPARILVADNDEDVLALVAFRLRRAGYEVLLARDGDEALAQARAELPDLCVLDVMMPGLTGVEVTQRLRSDESTRTLPVILLTARVQEADLVRGYAAGANAYVRKPFDAKALRTQVETLLAERDGDGPAG
jgi:DNA-binding response OmpR family regulator